MIERRNEMKEATVFRNLLCAGLICLLLRIGVADLQAQEAASQANETQDLAKKTQNPVSDLISLPFQNNGQVQPAGRDMAVFCGHIVAIPG